MQELRPPRSSGKLRQAEHHEMNTDVEREQRAKTVAVRAGKEAQMNKSTEIPFFQLSSSEHRDDWLLSDCI